MRSFKHRDAYLFLLSFVVGLTSCGVPERSISQPPSFGKLGKGIQQGQFTQAELQDDLLRFESQFNERIESASQALERSADSRIRYRATLNRLIYRSNALDIALGPRPESNLLDMVAFVELSGNALKRYWIPNVFGADGQALGQSFTESSRQIWRIADKFLNADQKTALQNVITAWRDKNPEQVNVESVRLSAFATEAGAKAAGLNQDVGGLFASVQQNTQAVDSAKLFAERVLYYAERAPFLFRLQARLGAHEMLDDAGFPQAAHSAMTAITQLTAQLKEMAGIANQVDRESGRFVKRLAWLGAGLISLFWIMFVISKLAYQYLLLKLFGSAKPASREQRRDKAA